jgi:hypothetical protein
MKKRSMRLKDYNESWVGSVIRPHVMAGIAKRASERQGSSEGQKKARQDSATKFNGNRVDKRIIADCELARAKKEAVAYE